MVDTIQTMERGHFVKSMTSYHDHTELQDVYHVPSDAGVLYIKFTGNTETGFKILSFKGRVYG